ncbi:MAG: hypothetical protein ACRD29_06310 [Acidimicrobiales bacterium]
MTALWFLLAALVISAIGSVILVLRYRKPSTEDWSIEEFRREMQALAPDHQRERPSRRAVPPPAPSGEQGR